MLPHVFIASIYSTLSSFIYSLLSTFSFFCFNSVIATQSAFGVPTDIPAFIILLAIAQFVLRDLKGPRRAGETGCKEKHLQTAERPRARENHQGGQTRPSCTGNWKRFMPHCTTALPGGLLTHQKYCNQNAVFEEVGAEARIYRKRDAIDDIGSPRPSGTRTGKVRVALFCIFAKYLWTHRKLWLLGGL